MDEHLEHILEAGGMDTDEPRWPCALTVAGSDSGGGAGAQADLKTFAASGVHGTSVLTLITAQNTREVSGMQMLPGEAVRRQYEAVVDDFEPEALKTGALGSAEMVRTVVQCLEDYNGPRVIDPVMISKHGNALMPEEGQVVLRDELLPHATVATPNRHEAQALSGDAVDDLNSMKEAARQIHDLGAEHVVIKGSHLEDVVRDILYDGSGFVEYGADRIDTDRLHGSGCVFSSAITARLARGEEIAEAVGYAREFITRAIQTAPRVGGGLNPVNPMHELWGRE
jgi:hydroxymethylpyrimidine/phosphomethylpyrimidine kinase